ncbi:MAG: Uma2 family endonuclease [Caldilineaceae bacterium]
MNTVTDQHVPEAAVNGAQQLMQKKYDRFRLGWRIRPRITPEGKVEYERIPLTAYDILHPQEEDFRVHNDEHRLFCRYLDNVISAQVAHIPGAVVLHDTRVAWDVPGLEAHGPDIALIFNVRERKKWGTFDVAVEGTRPALIIEVTSPETRRLDLEDKVEEYALAGVLVYIVVDAHQTKRRPTYQLIGYELTPDGYVQLQSDANERLWLEPAQIWLGLNKNILECFDAENKKIGDYVEVLEAYKAAETRAAEAEARAEEAEVRLHAMEEELRRLRGAE